MKGKKTNDCSNKGLVSKINIRNSSNTTANSSHTKDTENDLIKNIRQAQGTSSVGKGLAGKHEA